MGLRDMIRSVPVGLDDHVRMGGMDEAAREQRRTRMAKKRWCLEREVATGVIVVEQNLVAAGYSFHVRWKGKRRPSVNVYRNDPLDREEGQGYWKISIGGYGAQDSRFVSRLLLLAEVAVEIAETRGRCLDPAVVRQYDPNRERHEPIFELISGMDVGVIEGACFSRSGWWQTLCGLDAANQGFGWTDEPKRVGCGRCRRLVTRGEHEKRPADQILVRPERER